MFVALFSPPPSPVKGEGVFSCDVFVLVPSPLAGEGEGEDVRHCCIYLEL